MTIKRYHRDALNNFQKNLLKKRGGAQQVELLKTALRAESGEAFVQWMEQKMRQTMTRSTGITVAGAEPQLPAQPATYSAQQFTTLPAEAAAQLWETWKHINPGIFCSSGVWAYIVSRFIAEDKIKPHYLMVREENGENTAGIFGNTFGSGYATGHSDGRKEIDTALSSRKAVEIDACARAFLRRLSGLQSERSVRSVYQECPPAVAWWQHHIASDAAKHIDYSKEVILSLFSDAPPLWKILTDKMASQLTVIGDTNIRNGVLLFYIEHKALHPQILQPANIHKALDTIGIISAWRALGIFTPTEISEIIHEDILPDLTV